MICRKISKMNVEFFDTSGVRVSAVECDFSNLWLFVKIVCVFAWHWLRRLKREKERERENRQTDRLNLVPTGHPMKLNDL